MSKPIKCKCPVLTQYFRAASIKLVMPLSGDSLVKSVRLDAEIEAAQELSSTLATRRVRAMFCFLAQYSLLCKYNSQYVGLELTPPPRVLTREAVREVIKAARAVKISCDSILVAERLLMPGQGSWRSKGSHNPSAVRSLRRMAELAVEAGIFLRPRLRNRKSVGSSATYLVQGMGYSQVNLIEYTNFARRLINTTEASGVSHVW